LRTVAIIRNGVSDVNQSDHRFFGAFAQTFPSISLTVPVPHRRKTPPFFFVFITPKFAVFFIFRRQHIPFCSNFCEFFRFDFHLFTEMEAPFDENVCS